MWTRSLMLMLVMTFAVGCVDGGSPVDDQVATATQGSMGFHCVNQTSIHVVTCSGSISLFPITITIDSLRILSDNELSILSNDLNDVSILDGDILDNNKILNDVEGRVLDDFLDKFHVIVTKNEIRVCTLAGGLELCR